MHYAAVEILLLLLVGCVVGVTASRLRLPYTLALVLAGIGLGFVDPKELHAFELSADVLFTFLLPALLFEAALHLNLSDLRRNRIPILTLAVPGVLLATGITALLSWAVLDAGGLRPGFGVPEALLFGSMIAATDPISVLALFKELGVTRRLYLLVEGESLLNDGVAVVVFLITAAALGIEVGHGHHVELHGWQEIATFGVRTFFWMAGGGVLLGAAFGGLASTLMRQFDDHLVEVTITTIVAFGSFLAAEQLGCSGVLSTVTAGIVTGSFGTHYGMSTRTRLAVEDFWEYAAFVANTMVFLLLGLELEIGALLGDGLAILVAFAATLLGRAAAVYLAVPLTRFTSRPVPGPWAHVMWWGGLRGSLSMVLVLGLPTDYAGRDVLIHLVFGVVAASLFLQGLTVSPLLARLGLAEKASDKAREIDAQRARLVAVNKAMHELEELRRDGVVADSAGEQLERFYDNQKLAASDALGELLGQSRAVASHELLSTLLALTEVEREAVRHAGRTNVIGEAAVANTLGQLDERVSELKHALHQGESLDEAVEKVLNG